MGVQYVYNSDQSNTSTQNEYLSKMYQKMVSSSHSTVTKLCTAVKNLQ